MLFDRLDADVERFGDFAIGTAVGNETSDLPFAFAQHPGGRRRGVVAESGAPETTKISKCARAAVDCDRAIDVANKLECACFVQRIR